MPVHPLLDIKSYQAAMEHLGRPKRFGRRLALPRDEAARERVLSKLLEEVATGSYQVAPLEQRTVLFGGKQRLIHHLDAADSIVATAFALTLTETLEPTLSECLHSYRTGRSNQSALRAISDFVRAYRRSEPNPRRRALFTLRCDVTRYGESIRTDSDSPLWAELAELTLGWPKVAQALLRTLILHPVRGDKGAAPLPVGVPTGSPIQPAMCNLYLSALDHELSKIDGLCSLRFGDDFFLSSSDRSVAERAFALVEERCHERGLLLGEKKTRRLEWNGSGFSHDPVHYRGTSTVTYLGANLHFSGGISLPRSKARELYSGIARRLENLAAALDEVAAPEDRARTLSLLVRECLSPSAALADPRTPQFETLVNHRQSRVLLARRLERKVAELATGIRGVKALRRLPPRALRALGFPRLDQPARFLKGPMKRRGS